MVVLYDDTQLLSDDSLRVFSNPHNDFQFYRFADDSERISARTPMTVSL